MGAKENRASSWNSHPNEQSYTRFEGRQVEFQVRAQYILAHIAEDQVKAIIDEVGELTW